MHDVKECIVLERVNRFTAVIALGSLTRRAYISNTGRLVGYLSRGRGGFCVRQREGLKTDFRLFAVREGSLAAVIDTQLQMKTLEKIIELKLIPWLKPAVIRRRNAELGRSRIDYLLEHLGEKVYLEVKSAVLRRDGYAMYPDCPSMRGRRHIAELTEHVKKGGRGVILFIAALPDVEAFRPNSSADPEISRLLLEAAEAGVDIRAIGLFYDPEDSYAYLSEPDLPVYL
jgi:sugar fermentation stimulation protein A